MNKFKQKMSDRTLKFFHHYTISEMHRYEKNMSEDRHTLHKGDNETKLKLPMLKYNFFHVCHLPVPEKKEFHCTRTLSQLCTNKNDKTQWHHTRTQGQSPDFSRHIPTKCVSNRVCYNIIVNDWQWSWHNADNTMVCYISKTSPMCRFVLEQCTGNVRNTCHQKLSKIKFQALVKRLNSIFISVIFSQHGTW